MKKFVSICSLYFLISLNASGQPVFFKNYSVSDGLVNNAVRGMYQDSKGFLWIYTWEGLSKYNGYRFINFTLSNGLSHEVVNDIYENKKGEIYVADNNGTIDLIKNDQVAVKAYIKNIVVNHFFVTRKNKVLALTDYRGIYEITNDSLKRLSQYNSASVYKAAQLNDSLLALVADHIPVVIYDEQYHVFCKADSSNIISNCIFKDNLGRVWLGTDKGLKLLAGIARDKKISFQKLPAPFNSNLLLQNSVTAIFQEEDGTWWFGTNNGLIRILPAGNLESFRTKDGLPSENISFIFQDREKNIWIGTTAGVAKLVNTSVSKIILNKFYDDAKVYNVHRLNSEEILVFTTTGIFKGSTITGQYSLLPSPENFTSVICVQNSNPLIVISNNRLYRYDSSRNEFNYALTLPFQAYCAAGQLQQMFLGTQDGIYILENNITNKIVSFSYRVDHLMEDTKGFLWIGCWSNGLHRVSYNALAKNYDVPINDMTKFIPDVNIRSLYQDKKQNIWVGTRYNGAVMLAEVNPGKWQVKHFNHEQGLISNWVECFSENKKGDIWIGTLDGINKLVFHNDSYTVFNYSRISDFYANVSSIAGSGYTDLCCATDKGLVKIKDGKLEESHPLPVYITMAKLGNPEANYAYANNSGSPVALPFSQNYALFEFTSPGYLNEKELLYSYRLLGGADSTWSKPSNIHSVQYASLQPGQYKFEIKMLGWNNTFGPSSSFLFIINTPFWKSRWFYVLISIIFLLIIYSIYRYRINQLLRLQKVRDRIATDLHDDIGAALTNISILSELSKKNIDQHDVADKFLSRITEESTESQQALDDIIWSVNTNNDNLVATLARMRRYAAELFESNNIVCRIEFENVSSEIKLNMDQRRDLYLIFKECVNNIHKHANARNIYITAEVVHSLLKMKIRDDGNGFDTGIITDRNGLKNMKSRAQKWAGELTINSYVAKGTTIICKFPIR